MSSDVIDDEIIDFENAPRNYILAVSKFRTLLRIRVTSRISRAYGVKNHLC